MNMLTKHQTLRFHAKNMACNEFSFEITTVQPKQNSIQDFMWFEKKWLLMYLNKNQVMYFALILMKVSNGRIVL